MRCDFLTFACASACDCVCLCVVVRVSALSLLAFGYLFRHVVWLDGSKEALYAQ